MYKIGILSDTHGMMRPEVLTALQGCDHILHAGDINQKKIVEALERIAPTTAVCGNNDASVLTRKADTLPEAEREWLQSLPASVSLTLSGLQIFMVHNKKDIPKGLAGADLIVCGHSHKWEQKELDSGNRLFLNPGSCGPRRFNQEITLAILTVDDRQQIEVKKIVIPHAAPSQGTSKKKAGPTASAGQDTSDTSANQDTSEDPAIPADLAVFLPDIMKAIDAGKSVKQIAKKYRISVELSEEINRMYLTHPGVDVDGIMRRLGL